MAVQKVAVEGFDAKIVIKKESGSFLDLYLFVICRIGREEELEDFKKGRNLHEGSFSLYLYAAFWFIFLALVFYLSIFYVFARIYIFLVISIYFLIGRYFGGIDKFIMRFGFKKTI